MQISDILYIVFLTLAFVFCGTGIVLHFIAKRKGKRKEYKNQEEWKKANLKVLVFDGIGLLFLVLTVFC